METTLRSVVQGEIAAEIYPLDEVVLLRNGLYNRVVAAINESSAVTALTLPGDGGITLRDLDRVIADSRVSEVQVVVHGVLIEMKSKILVI
jgi:hypothetical protein